MLRVAHLTRRLPSALADAMWLPVASRSADVVVLAYVLFHLEDPGAAVAEAARVLRPRGRAGTVTWRSERSGRAQEVWNEALEDSGVPALPPRRVDENLDTIEGIEALLASGGLTPRSTWTEKLERRWDADSFWALVTGSGVNRQRLDQVSPAARTELLEQVRERIGRLGPDDFIWEGEVVCAVASADA
jgi:SAM-dependent methyltransferase